MSSGSGSRNTPPSNRYGSESEYSRRKRTSYPSSTRRDFKSSPGALPTTSSTSLNPRPFLRTESSNPDYHSRPKYRETGSSGNSSSPFSSRADSYSKDARYSSYNNKYSYSSSYDRANGAYGSFSNAKATDPNDLSTHSVPREQSGVSLRDDKAPFSRDSWRSERPKMSDGPSRYNSNPSRFGPRSGSNGLSSSVAGEYRKDRYEPLDGSYSGRWKPYTSRFDRDDRSSSLGSSSRSNTTKDRIRSSGLTNSVAKRSDSYYPYQSSTSHSNRYVDRYSRTLADQDEGHRSRFYPEKAGFHDTGRSKSPSTEVESALQSEVSLNNSDNPDEDEDVDQKEDDKREEIEPKPDQANYVIESLSAPENLSAQRISAQMDLTSDAHNNEMTETNTGPKQEPEDSLMQPVNSAENEIQTTNQAAYSEGCIFPETQIDSKLSALKDSLVLDEAYNQRRKSFVGVLGNFTSLPFFVFNLKQFSKSYDNYLSLLKQEKRALKKKQLHLWTEYESMSKNFNEKRLFMEEQLRALHPPDDEFRKELEAVDIRVKSTEAPPEMPAVEVNNSGRRSRRHGDLVTTEAEFQEILKSLRNEENEDPLVKAKRVAAKIPDLITDQSELQIFKFMDSNNFVQDKNTWKDRISTNFDTNFTEVEHDLFCEAFCRFPKRFGEISRYMGGLRTFGDCVMHYYITKKAVNYKFLVSQYKKKTSQKSLKKKKAASLTKTPAKEAISNTSEEKLVMKTEVLVGRPEETNGNNAVVVENFESIEPPSKKLRKEDGKAVPMVGIKDGDNEIGSESTQVVLDAPLSSLQDTASQVAGASVVRNDDVDMNGTSDERKKQITSYWSITEANEFPRLLNAYGKKWAEIAEKLNTKSATMVKNYYQRNAEKNGWDNLTSIGEPSNPRLGSDIEVSSTSSAKIAEVQIGSSIHSAHAAPTGSIGVLESSVPKLETQKQSIMSLLNNDSSPETKGLSNGLAPHRSNNLASLLNEPVSPTPKDLNRTDRTNSIRSLLG